MDLEILVSLFIIIFERGPDFRNACFSFFFASLEILVESGKGTCAEDVSYDQLQSVTHLHEHDREVLQRHEGPEGVRPERRCEHEGRLPSTKNKKTKKQKNNNI